MPYPISLDFSNGSALITYAIFLQAGVCLPAGLAGLFDCSNHLNQFVLFSKGNATRDGRFCLPFFEAGGPRRFDGIEGIASFALSGISLYPPKWLGVLCFLDLPPYGAREFFLPLGFLLGPVFPDRFFKPP